MSGKFLMVKTLLLMSFGAISQEIVVTEHMFNGNFFPTVIAGVILALAFQFILTALSVAVGITSLGDLKQQYAESTQNLSKSGEPNEREDHLSDVETPFTVKVTTGFGIWSVMTTCVALFLAATIALNLSGVVTQEAVIANSLVIWALFFILLFYFESKVAGTLIGGLIGTATAGFKASGSLVKSLFTPTKQQKLDKVLKTTIDRIRTEVNGMDTSAINETVERFVSKIDQKVPDYADLKSDLQEQARQSATKNTTAKWMAIEKVLSRTIEKNSKLDSAAARQKVNEAKDTLAQLKDAYTRGDDAIDGIKNMISGYSELDKKDIDKRIGEFKSMMTSMLPEDFEKAELKDKISTVINDPKVLIDAANNQFEKINRESIVAYLNENTEIDKSKLDEYADKIESIVERIAAEFDKQNDDRLLAKMENSVENYFNTTGRPELRYEALKNDFIHMLDNPQDSIEIVKARLSQMDGHSVKALLTNNRYVDEEHIDKVAQSYDDAKALVSQKISTIEQKSIQQYKMFKRKAVIQAEHARKTASVAAWWLVISALTSALAAVAGGLL